MNRYIATFYSHYEALKFRALLEGRGIRAKLMSVPRTVSSSCGTCCSFLSDGIDEELKNNCEAIYQSVCNELVCIYE